MSRELGPVNVEAKELDHPIQSTYEECLHQETHGHNVLSAEVHRPARRWC